MQRQTHFDELQVTLSSLIRHAGQVGVPLLTVPADNGAVIERVLLQEALWCVVAVDVDLRQGVVCSWLLTSFMDTRLQPWQQKF